MYCIIPCPSIMTKERSYNPLYGLCVDIPHVWCGCLARVVRMLSTCGADGMHHMTHYRAGIKKLFGSLAERGVWGIPFLCVRIISRDLPYHFKSWSPLFSSSVKATRKVSKHLTEEPLFASWRRTAILICSPSSGLHKISSFLFFLSFCLKMIIFAVSMYNIVLY